MRRLILTTIAAIPPLWLRRISWLPARRLAMGALNVALKQVPRNFDIVTPDGFRIAGTTRDLIQRYIYVFGFWEPDATAAIAPVLTKGSTVVDVGANVGYFTLLAAQRVGPEGLVHAIEALPSTVSLLRQNLALNDLPNVTVHWVAAGETSGEVEMFRASDAFLGSSSTHVGEQSEGRVRAERLDDLLHDVNGSDVSLIKIDVEGAEASVLRGAVRLLEEMSPGSATLVELAPAEVTGEPGNAAEVLALMEGFGFAAFAIRNEYSSRRYADRRVAPPTPLANRPTGWTDVLFMKPIVPSREGT